MAIHRILLKKSFVLDFVLILLLLYLLYVYINVYEQQEEETEFFSSKRGKPRIKTWKTHDAQHKPPDHRSRECLSQKYKNARKASLVSYFHNFQLYDLKMALSGAIYNNEDYIGELIVVDDGSNEQMVVDDAREYFEGLLVSVTLVKNQVYSGVAKSLNMALQKAKYNEIVIFDPMVIFSEGWLQPLLEEIVNHPRTIATPHFDKISDAASWKYESIDEDHVALISWNLQTTLAKVNDSTNLASPSMRPELFAVQQSFLSAIGSIDAGFAHGGGEALELAMRAWCCGGSVKLVSCSRVAVANFQSPIKISSGINLRRLIGLWFQDDPNFVIPLSKIFKPTESEATAVSLRRKVLSPLKCKSASWYFTNVLKKHLTINSDTVRYGHLKAQSGYCAHVASDFRINMLLCELKSKKHHEFQLTESNRLLAMGKCLTANPNFYVTLEACQNSENQKWVFTEKLELFNVGSGSCATHVTDPEQAASSRQIIMVQGCIEQQKIYEKFKKWTFSSF